MAEYRSVIKRVLSSTKSMQLTWPYIGPTFAICGALLWGTAMVYASMYARLPMPHTGSRTLVIGLGAIAGLFVACGAFGTAKRHVLVWLLIFLGGLVAGGLAVWHFGVDGVTRINDDAIQEFVSERHEFANDPAGFPYFSRMAHDAWKTNIELNDTDVQSTADAPPGTDASPANVEIHAGFCVVNLTPRSLERFLGSAEASEYRQDVLWVAVAREVGRCVDVSRDEGAALAPGLPLKSLAPVDAYGISSSHEYFLATKKATTRAWRDGFADAFAIGWMRLTKPQYARQLADTLRHEREVSAPENPAYAAGSCAISTAMKTDPPSSLEDLPAWTDRVRLAACHG